MLVTSSFSQTAMTGVAMLRDGQSAITPCPVCLSEDAEVLESIRTILGAFDSGPDDFDTSTIALCTPHVIDCLGQLGSTSPLLSRAALLTTQSVRARLEAGGPGVVDLIAGADPDAASRAGWAEPVDRVVTLTTQAATQVPAPRATQLLATDSCPIGNAAAVGAELYLRWLLAPTPGSREPSSALLCPRHLHDATGRPAVDADEVARAVEDNRAFWAKRIATVSSAPAADLRRVVRAQAEVLTGQPICGACKAADNSLRSMQILLAAAITDAAVLPQLQTGHGVCLRHALGLPATSPLSQRARTQVAYAKWELDEATRHSRWEERYDVTGVEMSAWLRVPTVLDCGIYCGSAGRSNS